MIIKPSVTELLTKAKNRYELVIATSKRARQIAEGDEPLIKDKSPVTIAANEIAEGKVNIIREDEQEETSENAVEENEKAEETTEEQNEESEEN